ncbi:hypothetical protein [Legionella jamestowniensis]|uniref:Uncharacterized protein n=1 Tax=Legionella jamestowniensis TaxID=455 RepID=A0A0W0UIU1_9GAMM|nr:hypothetical protein [Legionella jamestowniensis]KTD07749.1 hypothetical protein Ljam_1944 [Legionella jamestowniensis]OCH99483.1 hypothetical protein A8135_07320 [Legionella jamestowniensis]SFL61589.1 hypothetical protein SAMN02746073_1065 [Legionella jamestowniensis DSM 19215]
MTQEQLKEKLDKTLCLLAVASLASSIFYLVDVKFGLAATIAINGCALYAFHEIGKNRRIGSNVLHRAHTFFAAQGNRESAEIYNAFRNIINGGAAVYDELILPNTKPS